MRLVFTDPLLEFNLNCLTPWTIVIENRELFTLFTGDLWNQCNGKPGRFIFSDDEKELSLEKKADFIFNIFDISCNGKKLLNKIYAELSEISNDELQIELHEVNSRIVSFLDLLSNKLPYELAFDLEPDIIGLFKAYNMRIDEDEEGATDKIVSYIRLSHQALGTELIIFINLRQFFEDKDIELIYEACKYEQVCVIDIEGNDSGVRLSDERCVIIDRDYCIINLD